MLVKGLYWFGKAALLSLMIGGGASFYSYANQLWFSTDDDLKKELKLNGLGQDVARFHEKKSTDALDSVAFKAFFVRSYQNYVAVIDEYSVRLDTCLANSSDHVRNKVNEKKLSEIKQKRMQFRNEADEILGSFTSFSESNIPLINEKLFVWSNPDNELRLLYSKCIYQNELENLKQ
ncbi:hypothetical protein [Motilimonas sp. KMU-193]|uniref:hypothetical protein n=1 Tax=Motilimonas sp. KMU-193 TaxID=3388668 RepID=UPI00396B0EC1